MSSCSLLSQNITTRKKVKSLNAWCIFIDLVKAYVTVNHEVIQIALRIFGIPVGLRNKTKRLYDNFRVG